MFSVGDPVKAVRAFSPAVLCCLVGLLIIPFDSSLCGLLDASQIPGDIRALLHRSETFGHGMGVALILISLAVLHPSARRYLPLVSLSAYGAGVSANFVKLLFVRTRPGKLVSLDQDRLELFNFTSGIGDFVAHVEANAQQSFPSAHTATAAGLAVGLSTVFPRGRYLFAVLAVMVGMQRLMVQAHFLSDVFVGGGVGIAVGTLCRFAIRSFIDTKCPASNTTEPPTIPVSDDQPASASDASRARVNGQRKVA